MIYLRNRYALCLEEQHVVFANLRAIATFIDCYGLDDAWMNAKWFNTDSCKCVDSSRNIAMVLRLE